MTQPTYIHMLGHVFAAIGYHLMADEIRLACLQDESGVSTLANLDEMDRNYDLYKRLSAAHAEITGWQLFSDLYNYPMDLEPRRLAPGSS